MAHHGTSPVTKRKGEFGVHLLWEECIQEADGAARARLILFQSTEEGFVDEGQLLRVSVNETLSIRSESTRTGKRHCQSMECTL